MSASFQRRATDANNSEQARNKWQQSTLRALAKAPLATLAEALDKDESGACRVRSGETKITFNEALALVSALGLKVVSADAMCVSRDKYGAMATLLQSAMSDPVSSHRLIWEDDQ